MFFPNKTVRDVLGLKLGVDGLSVDGAVLFSLDVLSISDSHVFLLLENEELARYLYDRCTAHKPEDVFYFPKTKGGGSVPGFDTNIDRFRSEVFSTLDRPKACLFITTKQALKEKAIKVSAPAPETSFFVSTDDKINIQDFQNKFIDFGYRRVDTVFEPLSFAVRGEVFDFYTNHHTYPVRVLFDYNKIESMSWFNQSDQLSTDPIKKVQIKNETDVAKVVDYIGLMEKIGSSTLLNIHFRDNVFSINSPSVKKSVSLLSNPVKLKSVGIKNRIDELVSMVSSYDKVFIVGDQLIHNSLYKKCDSAVWVDGCIKKGFVYSDLGLIVFSAHQLYKNYSAFDRWSIESSSNQNILTMADLSNMKNGDYLVHKDFGVGVFRGLAVQKNTGAKRESIEIEYNNNSRVYVSLEKMDLVHRYLGSATPPKLSTIGTKKWLGEINKTKKAVSLVASELLSLYSKKKKRRSFNYSSDKELELSLKNSFPFLETKDQKSAIEDIFMDLEKNTPMDRLVCGDVGFGKTEVAIRAIFKAVVSGRQVAFLCPTTILADQHFITCKERFATLGVNVSLISRFKTKKEQALICQELKDGKIDVLIGTHRLLSSDVVFSKLGLLIIDEEHRFGVIHKEKIRQLKEGLDVLVLTATPIPRTLQHSLVGLKDISVIQTAPLTRKPINTSVEYFNWDTVFSYIQTELNRYGQVYFLHNDITAHNYITTKLRGVFQNSVVENIHGKMNNDELEGKILSFFDGKVDILVCTTIIESGIDVSNANCIIINDAHKFGLSQLYQIRGRVGRGHNQASCYLLIPKKPLEKNAYKRLKTIEQLTSLGSGYEISMKDLEIRGAGSLFGYKQSGHISQVGFEMYCEILKDEINLLSGSDELESFPDVLFYKNALIEEEYIKTPSQRLSFYNRLSMVKTKTEITIIINELIDRFGKIPLVTKNLIFISKLRVLYKNLPVTKIDVRDFGVNIYIANKLDVASFLHGLGVFSKNHGIKYLCKKGEENLFYITFFSKNIKTSKKILKDAVYLFSKPNKR